jgi:hypothetical protein
VVGWGQTNSILGGGLQVGGVPPNFEARKNPTGKHENSIYTVITLGTRQQRILGSPTLIFFG